MYTRDSLQQFFDRLASQRDEWIARNAYYYKELYRLNRLLIEENTEVLDIGCGTGNVLAAVNPRYGEGIDFSHEMVKIATRKYPHLTFKVMDAHHLEYQRTFDYVILSNLVGYVSDIWQVFREIRKVCHPRTRIVITNYNYWWQPLMAVAEKLRLKMPDRIQNWLPQEFIEHFLYLSGFEVIRKGKYLHCPVQIPYLSDGLNALLSNVPLVSQVGLIEYMVARPTFHQTTRLPDVGVSVIVPTHEEAGNIEAIIEQLPKIGAFTELIFVDLPGKDATGEKIRQVMRTYSGPLIISYVKQAKKSGKIGALRLGVSKARGEVILIYDADLTVPPDDLVKFYTALIERKGDVINGTRLVYPTEKGAMRFINHLGNKLFAVLFTWGLNQHFTDTLCGSKGFWKSDFVHFETTKTTFDDLDPFGDFYLLLAAYRRNLKIAEVPVRYKTRRYGDTKLNRLHNGYAFLKTFLYFFWQYRILRRRDF